MDYILGAPSSMDVALKPKRLKDAVSGHSDSRSQKDGT